MTDFGDDVCFVRDGSLFRFRAAAIILWKDCVLMAENSRDTYLYSVGGAVKLGETAEDAVRREVKEETGLDLPVSRLAVIHQNYFQSREAGRENWHELAFYYLMDYRGEPIYGTGSETMIGAKERMVWVPLRELPKRAAYPVFFGDMQKVLTGQGPLLITTRESYEPDTNFLLK